MPRILRGGAIISVADFGASLGFYRDQLGLPVAALYDDPPYATLDVAGARISLSEQGHPSEDRPGILPRAPVEPSRPDVMLVLEVDDARSAYQELASRGVQLLGEPYEPPWGGCRFFCVDPDGFLVEVEQAP